MFFNLKLKLVTFTSSKGDMKTKSNSKELQPVNLKQQNAKHSFNITIRDREHFYKIVTWLNKIVGRGEDKWTMEGRALKSLKMGKSITRKVYVFQEDFDASSALYLSIL